MTSLERPSTITGAQTIDVDGSDKTKQVRKAGVPPASTRSYFAKNPLLPPFQSKGQEIISGSTLRDELAYEESEQIEAVNKTEAGLMENTYRIAPDPRKKIFFGSSSPLQAQLNESQKTCWSTNSPMSPTIRKSAEI